MTMPHLLLVIHTDPPEPTGIPYDDTAMAACPSRTNGGRCRHPANRELNSRLAG